MIEEIKKLKLEDGDLLFIKVKPGSEEKLERSLRTIEKDSLIKCSVFIHAGEIEDIKVVQDNRNIIKEPIGEDMND